MTADPTPPDRAGYEATGPPGTVYGVDFSAASADAGRKTWIAELDASDADPVLVDCAPAARFLSCGPARDATHSALVDFVRDLDGDNAVGFDFPFGVPRFLLDREGIDDRRAFLAWLPGRLDDPDDFSGWGADHTRAHTDGDRTYLGRRTDDETAAKSAYGFIAKYPAFYGMIDVLAPLVAAGDATVVPTMAAEPDRALVLETYPAAALDRRGLCRENYKGAGESERRRRARNLDGLATELGGVPDALHRAIVDDAGGDALDSVAAAVAAYTNTRGPAALWTDEPEYLLEGRIYA